MTEEIMHYVEMWDRNSGELRYICNWAVGTTPAKSTMVKEDVTCQNCLRIFRRREQEAKKGDN